MEARPGDWLVVVMMSIAAVWGWVLVRRNWRAPSGSNAMGDRATPPEYLLVVALCGSVLAPLVIVYVLAAREVSPFATILSIVGPPAIAAVLLLWLPMFFFDRPRFLIPPWRRAEMAEERAAARERRSQRWQRWRGRFHNP